MRYSRRPKDPNNIEQYRRRPDNPAQGAARSSAPKSSADEAMDWLESDDAAGGGYERETQGEVGARYERDAYSGRHSSSGAERFHRQATPKDPSKRVRPATIVKRVLICLAAVIVVGAVWLGVWLHGLDETMQMDDTALDKALTGVSTPFKPYYVLIVGSDARGDEASRTDTIILARVDPVENQVTLISIPRDTYVEIDGYGASKINAAYAYGGAALTVTTVSEFAGVDIAHFVEVGFDGFQEIVDAVGGVTVDVPADTTVDDVTLPEGTQTLNGEQALVFVRCRKTYALGDYQRAANQRQFLVALLSSIKKAPVWQWPGIIESISACVGTDCSSGQLLWMALQLWGMDTDDMYTAVVPSYTDTIDGVSYVVAYDDDWSTMMNRVEQGLDPNT